MGEETTTASQPVFTDLSSETLLSLGDSYFVDENYDDAVEAYAAALSLFRESEVVLQIRTLSHRSSAFYKLQRFEEALEDAENSLMLLSTKKPDGLRTGEGEICHLRVGLAAFELKQHRKAKDILEKASQLAALNKRDANKETYASLLAKCDANLSSSASEQTSTVAKTSPSVASKSIGETKEQADVAQPSASSESAAAAAAARPKLAGTQGKAPKYQYYQSDKVMTISILEAGVREQDLTVRFQPKHLLVTMRKNGTNFTVIAGNLYAEIDIERSKVVFKDEKVLVKLRKVEPFEWHELMGKGDDSDAGTDVKTKIVSSEETNDDAGAPPQKVPTDPKDEKKPSPYASHKDWDAIERDMIEDEKNEKPEGDEAMNKLFKQIYSNASDDTRRAMVKSFQTSGGTVLSTNWDEVKEKDYEKERTGKKN